MCNSYFKFVVLGNNEQEDAELSLDHAATDSTPSDFFEGLQLHFF